MMVGATRAVYRIPAGAQGPCDARGIIARELAGRVPPRRLDDLKLLVSEIVTERVRGRRSDEPEAALLLDLSARETIRCQITDTGPARMPEGHSREIVELLADRWGVVRDRETTSTWFESSRLGSLESLLDASPADDLD